MDRSSASAYVYAKASGMLAKSFTGARAAKLFAARKLADLWTLIFNSEVPLVPENMLAQLIQEEAEKNFFVDFIKLVDAYNKPDTVLIQLLRSYDYHNIKMIAAALCDGRTEIPKIADIGTYSMLNYRAWPRFSAITSGSSIEWYDKVPAWETQKEMDTRLDLQYTKELWATIFELPSHERRPVETFLCESIVLENIIWAIRLRVYYNMSSESILERLASEKDVADKKDVLSGPAVGILDKALDSWDDWKNWKYADLLNPHEEGVVWTIDPRWIQQAAKVRLNKIALSQFHLYPFTPHVLVTWFKIKEHELNCIRTASEGLRLNVNENQVKQFAGLGV